MSAVPALSFSEEVALAVGRRLCRALEQLDQIADEIDYAAWLEGEHRVNNHPRYWKRRSGEIVDRLLAGLEAADERQPVFDPLEFRIRYMYGGTVRRPAVALIHIGSVS